MIFFSCCSISWLFLAFLLFVWEEISLGSFLQSPSVPNLSFLVLPHAFGAWAPGVGTAQGSQLSCTGPSPAWGMGAVGTGHSPGVPCWAATCGWSWRALTAEMYAPHQQTQHEQSNADHFSFRHSAVLLCFVWSCYVSDLAPLKCAIILLPKQYLSIITGSQAAEANQLGRKLFLNLLQFIPTS